MSSSLGSALQYCHDVWIVQLAKSSIVTGRTAFLMLSAMSVEKAQSTRLLFFQCCLLASVGIPVKLTRLWLLLASLV